MKIAITGGASFVGTRLAQAYLDAGHDVLVIDSRISREQKEIDPRARFYQVDVRDPELGKILQRERPDLVSHHALQQQEQMGERALTDADVHVRGLLNVLEGCVNASVQKIIFASGGCNFYGQVAREHFPIPENAPLCPQSTYDISKVAGEWYVRYYTRQYGLKHTILRYADVYGEIQMQHPLSYFLTMLTEQRRPIIRGHGEEIRDHIFIDDVIRANFSILKRGENRTLHISSGQGSTVNQLYRFVANELGSTLEPIYLSAAVSEPLSVILDNRLAQQVLQWKPEVSLVEGIRRMITQLQKSQEEIPVKKTDELKAIHISRATEATLSRA